MITRCNQCNTKFEISAELVEANDPTVRCGECLSVFDARAHLVTEEPSSYVATKSAHRSAGKTAHKVGVNAVASKTTASTPAAAVEAYAHIDDEDLENAATVVLEDTPYGSAAALPSSSAPDRRVNDGFYSPDLNVQDGNVTTYLNQTLDVEADQSDGAGGKIDPQIDTVNLDSTSLEFERTLALEGFSSEDMTSEDTGSAYEAVEAGNYSMVPDDVYSMNTSAPVRRSIEPGTPPLNEEPLLEYSIEESETGLPRIPLDHEKAGRDFPHISDDVLSKPPVAYSTPEDGPVADNALRSADANSPDHRSSEYRDTRRGDPDSASELRRYVNSRGGEVFPVKPQEPATGTGPSGSMFLPLVTMLLLACGVLYMARDTVARMNLPLPLLSTFCSVTDCELPMQKDVEQLQLVRHQMFGHASLDNALVISVDLINEAAFPQPYPVLVVTMANSAGESVAFRKFQPAEYLEAQELSKTLPAGQPVRIKFEIVDPGPEALSSELSFE